MDRSGPNRLKLTKWTEIDQSGPNWTEMDKIDRNKLKQTKVDRIGLNRWKKTKWTEVDHNGPKWDRIGGPHGPKQTIVDQQIEVD